VDEARLGQLRMECLEGMGKASATMAGIFDKDIGSMMRDSTYARLVVEAVDVEAARLLARKHLHRTLDAINFYSDVLHSGSKVYLPGQAGRHSHCSLEFQEGPPRRFTCRFSHQGPLPAYSVGNLESGAVRYGWDRISEILQNRQRTKLEERILSACEWAGRATVSDRKEEAFLFFAVSLEVLLLGSNVESELTHRLATRGAHLLMKDFQGRREVQNDLKRLYRTRSGIVHSGRLMVTEAELGRIRFLAKTALVIVLTQEPYMSMRSNEEFDKWFEDEPLRGTAPHETPPGD
jgi:hypothetical protein